MGQSKVEYLVSLAVALFLVSGLGAARAEDGNAMNGKKHFRQCGVCHSLEKGKTKVGPSLAGLFGRPAASVAGYRYSSSLAEAGEKGLVWDEEQVFAYLGDPTAFLKRYLDRRQVKNKMKNKFKKEAFRRDVIAYLRKAAR
ncbi:MAG: c-type cytochrome [Alphaproteobacteria bacterium]|nr:c-type cytochrome [Alphaproteobacteria bacterium]